MKRRFFLKALVASIAATNLYRFPALHAENTSSLNFVLPLKVPLSGSGRLGFYVDYSELDNVGSHTFYVTRTHGSSGVVGCTWTAYDSADGAQLSTGILSWEDGSLDILSLTVDIATKPAGDHRIYVILSNPEGGAALHHGDSTIAYGIIDDDTIATSNAIFIDANMDSNGNGTQNSPYNNWYSARDALKVSDRVIYIKGMLVPDDTDNLAMSESVKHLALKNTFEGRTTESQRLVIRSWPTFAGGVDGGGQTDVAGFACDGASSSTGTVRYISFRKLSATNLNNQDGGTVSGKCYFLRTRGFGSDVVEHFTAEHIHADGLVSGANAAVAVWFSETCSHFKLWRWSVANTSHIARDYNLKTFLCFRTDNVSVQRCTIERTAGGLYEKEGFGGETKVGMSLRFNHLKGCQVRFSTQSTQKIQDFHIVQNNIFDEVEGTLNFRPLRFDMSVENSSATKQHVSNNIFYKYDFSTYADVNVSNTGFEGLILYNNIHYKTKRPWRLDEGVNSPEYIDYNHYEFNGTTAPIFRYLSDSDIPLTDLINETSFDANTTSGDPIIDLENWQLDPSSPCYQEGVYGSNKGVYLLGIEKIGAGDSSNSAPPEKMSAPDITVV